MRVLVARATPIWSGLRDAGTRTSTRLAASLAGGTMLAIAAWAFIAPHDDGAGVRAEQGGETVIAKFAKAKFADARAVQVWPKSGLPEPTPVNRLVSMALAPVPALAPPADAEPNLAGLSEIPRELIWNRPPDEGKERPKVFAAFSKVSEQLPWDAVEPVPFSPVADVSHAEGPTAKKVAAATPPRAPVEPVGAEVATWVKTKVTEIKGTDRSRPLYHFELWLEPPADVKGRLVGVAYEFNTPAIRPQSQSSSDKPSGFRISAGGLACADRITLTLRFDDGGSQKIAIDGCELLS